MIIFNGTCGLLPALVVETSDGRKQTITESQVIMELLDQWHSVKDGYRQMLPSHEIIPTVLLVLSWSIMILLATSKYAPPRISTFISEASLSPGLISAFLSPIALLLSIRANRAINRLMEVRTAWGVLGKAIRSLTGTSTIATYGVFSEEEGNEQMMKTSFLAARYTINPWMEYEIKLQER